MVTIAIRIATALLAICALLCSGLALAQGSVPPWSMGAPIVTYTNWARFPPGGCGTADSALEGIYGWPKFFDPTTLTSTMARQSAAGGFNVVSINDPSRPPAEGSPTSIAAQNDIAARNGLRTQLRLGDACNRSNLIFRTNDTSDHPCSLGHWRSSCWPYSGTDTNEPVLNYLNKLIDQFKASPAAYSYALADEPCERPGSPESKGDACGSKLPLLAAIAGYIRQRDPAHLVYVNLLPPRYGSPEYTAPPGYATYASYDQFLTDFINQVHPALLSYDSYNLLQDRDGSPIDDTAFLTDTQAIARAAVKYSIPFMAIVQGMKLSEGTNPRSNSRVPAAGDLAFLASAVLAFGGQGISYFNYWSARGPSWGGIAPQYPDGAPTSVYTALQSVNPIFRKVAARLQGLKWSGTYLKGYATPPPGLAALPNGSTFDIPGLQNRLRWSPASPGATYGPPLKGALIGYFGVGDTATFAFVVNLDCTASHAYRITGPGPMSAFDSTAGTWTPSGRAYVDVTLSPGGGALVGLTSAESTLPRVAGDR